MLEDLIAGPTSMRRTSPPRLSRRSGSGIVTFRWQLENWQAGPLRQMPFQFVDGTKFMMKNQQSIDSMNLEIIIKPADPVLTQDIWYIEATVLNAFDSQQSVVIYSPIMISPDTQEAILITSVNVTDLDSFFFQNNTLVIDFRFSDEEFPSNGSPPMLGSTIPFSREPVPYAGLMNNGSNCFMNCVLQSLYHLPAFRAVIYDIDKSTLIIQELQRLFGGLQVSTKTCSTRLLSRAISSFKNIGWNDTDVVAQREPDEFLKLLINHLKYMTEEHISRRFQDLFMGKYIVTVRCMNVDHITTDMEMFDTLTIDVKGFGSLEESLTRFVGPHLMMGDAQCETDRYGRQDASVSFSFLQFPPVLYINLKRFETNERTGKREKIADYMSFPCELDLSKFIPDSTDLYHYELFGVMVHAGATGSGHYLAYIKPAPGDQWYQFNDSTVMEATLDQATVQNFGGSSVKNAFMLLYIKKNEIARIFQDVLIPPRIHSLVSEVKVRSPPSIKKRVRTTNNKHIKLLLESDFRKAVLEGYTLLDLAEIPNEIEIEENDTNHELYAKIAASMSKSVNMIRVWKVGPNRLPTSPITENMQKCSTKETILYVQELMDPQMYFQKSMRMAFISFFFPQGTPKVQYIGSTTIMMSQGVSQIFPYIWSVLNIPGTPFEVYCDGFYPIQQIPQNRALIDMGLNETCHFIVEPQMQVQVNFDLGYCAPKPDDVISYYSMIRPNGDTSAEQFLERRAGQLIINIYKTSDTTKPVCTVSAPERLPATELPALILFATRAPYDSKKDTLQIFRRKFNSESNEIMPYTPRKDVTVRNLFVSELRRQSKITELKLFYDIVVGYTAEQLKSMVMRTVEIYDRPVNCKMRIRVPMKEDEPLEALAAHIRRNVFDCGNARFLIDEEGLIRNVNPGEVIEENQVIRFDVIPEDQLTVGPNEVLVVLMVCRSSKHRDNPVNMKQSFIFKVIEGEDVDTTCHRVVRYGFTDPKVAEYLSFVTSSGRILNGNECLYDHVKEYDHVRVLLPDRAKENSLLRDGKQEKHLDI